MLYYWAYDFFFLCQICYVGAWIYYEIYAFQEFNAKQKFLGHVQ